MFIRALLLLQLALFSPTALAEMIVAPCPDEEVLRLQGFTLRSENDSFAKTDRNYSQGLALSAQSFNIKNRLYDECLPLPLRVHSQLFELITPNFWLPPGTTMNSNSVAVKIGQSVYTPRDLKRTDLTAEDRPYAGLLFGGLALHQRHSIVDYNVEVLESREITLGVIGPLSFAKEFQDTAHDFTRDERANGWSHQLSNEPAAQVAFDKKFKIDRGGVDVVPGLSADLIPAIGVRLGNIETSANFGFEMRLGWDLPNDFGSLPLRPGTESRSPETEKRSNRIGFHFFSLVDLRFVGYSFAVDGNLFSNEHRVTREPWITLGAFGFNFPVIVSGHGYSLAIMQVYQTSDFKEQDASHAYRSIALSFEL